MRHLKLQIILMLSGVTLIHTMPAQTGVPGGSGSAARASGGAEVAFKRAKHLQRGINVSQWFGQVYDKRGYTRVVAQFKLSHYLHARAF